MAWMHSYSLDGTPQDPSSSLIPLSEDYEENLASSAWATHSPLQAMSTSSYNEEYMHAVYVTNLRHHLSTMIMLTGTFQETAMPLEVRYGDNGSRYEMPVASIAGSTPTVTNIPSSPPLSALAAPPFQLPSVAPAVTEEATQPVTATGSVSSDNPVIKVRKNKVVLGEPTLAFQCNGQDYIRLSDQMLEQDLQTMYDPDYRGFFEGLGEKVTYVIAVSAPIDTSNVHNGLQFGR
ncbi:hypothetical protein EIP86_007707 [Pleurotus ostreatoroseus]|nr:hypothetical protein EIP86_007707 [Pleurotus ostreatoroseus]